ncbi:TPA: polysaccharide biosynthesis protein, partial [Enterobacter hormaechei subsp. xiangfangensis]|nr:polysaccharide biosynthesis protein [Enterobacter hormaechei subsp. xiangfangensis]HAV1949646.1 polysaccharide biosynthesis protein [Enterobacter hormaechei subsp. xiangfangensis]
KPLWADEHFITQEFRNKYAWVNVLKNLGPLNIFLKTFLIIRRTNCRAIVTTGPGIAISAAIAAKLLNVKIIHIETWSRFTTRSFSGRIMYHLASKFYVQNESLLQLYPKAIFSGRL